MIAIKQEILDRKSEINVYLLLIEKLENGTCRVIDQTGCAANISKERITQKASAILLLYNFVESIITKCLQRVHSKIINENIEFSNLIDPLQIMILSYHQCLHDKKSNADDISLNLHRALRLLTNQYLFELQYDDMIKHYSLYSGNLDSRKIEYILQKYGLRFEEKCSELQTVKDFRNKLAHGEISFEECGRQVTSQQLNIQRDRIFRYFDAFVIAIEDYLNHKRFKI
jgi:hypothetical protein